MGLLNPYFWHVSTKCEMKLQSSFFINILTKFNRIITVIFFSSVVCKCCKMNKWIAKTYNKLSGSKKQKEIKRDVLIYP